MAGGHHPRGAVEHRTEVVRVPEFRFAGRNPHPDGQLQLPLCSDGRVDSRLGRCERGDHPVARVTEQKTAVRLDFQAQHLVMCDEGRPHGFSVVFPPTGRPLDIGEQKRHNPRRGHPRGHPRRMSHRALLHGSIATGFCDLKCRPFRHCRGTLVCPLFEAASSIGSAFLRPANGNSRSLRQTPSHDAVALGSSASLVRVASSASVSSSATTLTSCTPIGRSRDMPSVPRASNIPVASSLALTTSIPIAVATLRIVTPAQANNACNNMSPEHASLPSPPVGHDGIGPLSCSPRRPDARSLAASICREWVSRAPAVSD